MAFTLKIHYTAQGHLDDFELKVEPTATIESIKAEVADIMDAPDAAVTVDDLRVTIDSKECEDEKTAADYSLEKLGETPLQVNHRRMKRISVAQLG